MGDKQPQASTKHGAHQATNAFVTGSLLSLLQLSTCLYWYSALICFLYSFCIFIFSFISFSFYEFFSFFLFILCACLINEYIQKIIHYFIHIFFEISKNGFVHFHIQGIFSLVFKLCIFSILVHFWNSIHFKILLYFLSNFLQFVMFQKIP